MDFMVEEPRRTVTVVGTGKVSGIPDIAVVDIGISLVRPTVGEATAEAARRAQALVRSLRDGGVKDRDMQTVGYCVFTEMDHRGATPRVVGHRVQNTLRTTIRTIDSLPVLVDRATTVVGDSASVSGVHFAHSDPDVLAEAARTAAWDNAVQKAQQLADLARSRLGAAVTMRELDNQHVTDRFQRRALEAAESAPPIATGDVDVSVTLEVTFELA